MFYPEDEPVSIGLIGQDIVLEPLSIRHVQIDYEAVMESKEQLRRLSLSEWPRDDFTIEENGDDLTRHENEHFDRIAFTYTVLKPDGSECFGCVYMNPLSDELLAKLSESDKTLEGLKYVSIANFWIRESKLPEKLDRLLLEKLLYWFDEEFSFDKVLFSTSDKDDRQVSLFQEFGLKQIHRSEQSDGGGAQLIFVRDVS